MPSCTQHSIVCFVMETQELLTLLSQAFQVPALAHRHSSELSCLFWDHPMVCSGSYSQLCLVITSRDVGGDHMWCQGSSLCWLCAKQAPYPVHYLSAPWDTIFSVTKSSMKISAVRSFKKDLGDWGPIRWCLWKSMRCRGSNCLRAKRTPDLCTSSLTLTIFTAQNREGDKKPWPH